MFNKDESDNNCLHYAYMMDMPEVRQLLRDAHILDSRATRLNRRGQLPTKLRHFIKCEDSDEDTEDDGLYEQQEMELNNLMITGNAIETPEEHELKKKAQES